jgi:replicative DNA helicase
MYMVFLTSIVQASLNVTSPDDIDVVMSELQGTINSLAVRDGGHSMVDLFSPAMRKRLVKDLKRRRIGTALGIPTGLKRFDYVTGGLQTKRLVVIMGRPGLGKSWLDLLFVASSVINGDKTMLFPLEMSLEETALRLYTIFSCKMFGANKAIRNLDLSQGRITMKKIVRLMHKLEDLYAGQLFVADVASLSDPYTVERIEAEVELHKPRLFWVDYITLMKGPKGREGAEDHTTIKALTNGLKGIGQRHDCVAGASAQVNREALKTRSFLPRLEHLAYGDSIGMDSDQVMAINRKDEHLYYALVKNRHGPEIGRTRVRWAVDQGDIEETEHQDEDPVD